MRADARVDGHFVQGHVDATGSIEEIRQDGDCWWLTIKFPPSLAAQIVRKGSIAVDGISLTVAGVDDKRFDVQIVPFTWDHTTLKHARVNDLVNLEIDMLGKYVLRAMDLYRPEMKKTESRVAVRADRGRHRGLPRRPHDHRRRR